MLSKIPDKDACLTCGACCAYFRVSFYWAEGEGMPNDAIEQLSPIYSCMKGTNQKNPRCVMLSGEIGQQVSCNIYAQRSSSCKEVQVADEQCNKARLAYQMIPLVQLQDVAHVNEDFDRVS